MAVSPKRLQAEGKLEKALEYYANEYGAALNRLGLEVSNLNIYHSIDLRSKCDTVAYSDNREKPRLLWRI